MITTDERNDLIDRFLAARSSKDRLAVNRLIDGRDDSEEIYAEIRDRIEQEHQKQIRMLDAVFGRPGGVPEDEPAKEGE